MLVQYCVVCFDNSGVLKLQPYDFEKFKKFQAYFTIKGDKTKFANKIANETKFKNTQRF